MLDLAFVRANLELVEEKLRSRDADPALLGTFADLDARRRAAITQVETLKAERNVFTSNNELRRMETSRFEKLQATLSEAARKTEEITRRMQRIGLELGDAAINSEEFGRLEGERTKLRVQEHAGANALRQAAARR